MKFTGTMISSVAVAFNCSEERFIAFSDEFHSNIHDRPINEMGTEVNDALDFWIKWFRNFSITEPMHFTIVENGIFRDLTIRIDLEEINWKH